MKRMTMVTTVMVVAVLVVVLGCTQQMSNAAPAGGGAQGHGVRAGHGAMAQGWFERRDANKDGKITKDEFPGPDEAFARLDANGDGAITPEELPAAGGRMGGRGGGNMDPAQRWQHMCQRLDKDGDGKISKEEFPGPAEMFGRLDANGDGFLTQDEAQAAGARMREVMRDPAQRWQAMLQHLDKNGDGKIGKDEFPGRAEMFARLDQNGDGFITEDEAAAMGPGRGGLGGPGGPGGGPLRLLDTDGDGKVTREEWTAGFDKLDTNHDGVIDQQDRPQRPRREGNAQ